VYQEVSGLAHRFDLPLLYIFSFFFFFLGILYIFSFFFFFEEYFIFSVIHKCSFELISIVFFPCDVQLIWDRALGLPLERPKSVTMDWLDSYCKKAAAP
jgi:hypothetical protein